MHVRILCIPHASICPRNNYSLTQLKIEKGVGTYMSFLLLKLYTLHTALQTLCHSLFSEPVCTKSKVSEPCHNDTQSCTTHGALVILTKVKKTQ